MQMNHSGRTANPVPEKANLLLVDDTPGNLVALEAVLDDLGQNLVKACSGEEALRLLQEQDFAVILLDVRMPGLDGFETAKRIRSQERLRHTPILFMTAHDDNRRLEEEAARFWVSLDALALAAVLARPGVDVVLSGAAAVDQLRSNLAALAVPWDHQAAEMAESLAERLDLPIAYREDVLELDFGEWTGLTFDAVRSDERWRLWSTCRSIAEALYSRMGNDPVLGRFFPGKSRRCAIEMFSAFLVQFLPGRTYRLEARATDAIASGFYRLDVRYTPGP